MKAGFLAVLKSLSKNRKACDMLKWSPTKRSMICVCGGGVRQRTLRFPELSEQSDAESSDMRVQNESHRDEAMVVEEECLKSLQNYPMESDENLVRDTKSGTPDQLITLCDLRTKYNVRDCSVVVKNDDLHLKLDNDTISYQTTDVKPSQFSPHATSQSDSGIGSTDDELKSINDQCFCLGLDTWPKTPLTLLTIKKKVNSNEYSSLDRFNKEMEEMISNVQGTELLTLYYQTLEDVFPWFNPKCSEVLDSTTRGNHIPDPSTTVKAAPEEKSEDVDIKDVNVTLAGKLNQSLDYYYSTDNPVDKRHCILCKFVGEGKPTEEGRLIYCGQNDWVHTNCALWSNEVFEEIDGSLQNVQSAISRSRHIKCSRCNSKGASVGCCNRSCPEAYHFSCARNNGCIFFEDKSLFCSNHKDDAKVSRPLVTSSDFLVSRPVYVELDTKKKKYIAKHNINVMIGSLTINSLGDFVPDLSDQECSIIPCNFQCTRLFWSSIEPWRLVQYSIKTKIVYTFTETSVENDKNFTIDHSLESLTNHKNHTAKKCQTYSIKDNEIREVIGNILDVVCSKDEEDPQTSTDLLPPELKEAIFEDLPHDLLNGISMQDIFPKLMNFDSSMLDIRNDKEVKPVIITKVNKSANLKRLPGPEHFTSLSHSILPVKCNDLLKKSEGGISLKRRIKHSNEEIKTVNKLEEKENANNWSAIKILQIDGTGDCSSESSDLGSPVNEEPYIPLLHVRVQHTVDKKLFQTQACRKSRILQVDGVVDSCNSSCSSSECGSPGRDGNSFWKLGQVDGAMDFCSNKDEELVEENPVKCAQCHRTYRTAQSFERHLQTCSAEYILSCSESDSSEEDKISSSDIKLTDTDDTIEIAKPVCNDNSVLVESKEIASENVFPPHAKVDNLLSQSSSSMYNHNPSHNDVHAQLVVNHHSNKIICPNNDLPPDNVINSTMSPVEHQIYSSKPKTIRAMFECDKSQVLPVSACERKSPAIIRPVKTYARRKKGSTSTTTAVSTMKSSQNGPIMEYQTPTASPALIIQQVPSHSVMPSYIESLPQQPTSNNIQYQYIATIDVQDKPQIPLTIQLQPPISIQPVMPTVLGTIIQPNGVEQYVMNTPTPTVEMLNQQPTNVYITNVNQPMYVGMETVVSNTIMSSSQFVSGMLTGSSYSATTTQVFQTAKPVIDLPQSYVVVNTQSNPVTETPPHTIYPPHGPQPWTYNYQETYKVKERTTYQQVTRQIIQDQNNMDCVKVVNSTQEVFLNKPFVQEVTVEKTHSIHKTLPVPNLPEMVNNINPGLLGGRIDQEQLSHQESSIDIISSNDSPHRSNQQINSLQIENQVPHVDHNYEKNFSYNDLDVKKVNEKTQQYCELTKINAKNLENQTQFNVKEKYVRPIITKVKPNPNVKNSNFCVNLSKLPQVSDSSNKKIMSLSPEKNVMAVKKELVNETSSKSKLPCDGNNIQIKNEVKVEGQKTTVPEKRIPLKENKVAPNKTKSTNSSFKKGSSVNKLCNPKLVYEISSQDGISICSQDLVEAWKKIIEAVQSARAAKHLPPLPHNPLVSHLRMLGLDNNSVKNLIEQLPGARNCSKYKPVYHKSKIFGHNEQLPENLTGCARSEPYPNTRRKYDMFSWLASRHRRPPKLIVNSDTEIVNGISRRATSLNLPMAMRFRHLKETSKEAVGVFRSDIHGRGLFCLRDIDSGEMVIEYAGEVIRAGLTDKRENYYTSKGIGCYMFRIDDHFVVDATMHGNAARFINHSCEPNCYSRVVDILGKKHILIFALRKIPQGEELTYDYKFPLEDDRITCHCLSRKCRKYLN